MIAATADMRLRAFALFTGIQRRETCVALTGNVRWADAPGNVLLSARANGLGSDSVANVSQIVTLDRDVLLERIGKLGRGKLELIFSGLDIVLDRRTTC